MVSGRPPDRSSVSGEFLGSKTVGQCFTVCLLGFRISGRSFCFCLIRGGELGLHRGWSDSCRRSRVSSGVFLLL